MKQIRYIGIILCLIYVLTIPINATTVAGGNGQNGSTDTKEVLITNGCNSIDAANSVLGTDQIVDNVISAFVYETKSDTLMYSLNPDERVSPSSLVKILTALIAVERGNLDEIITVRGELLTEVPHDAVSADLQADEVITLRDLLYCLMVDSANDAAIVIADHIAGSQSAFVVEMNAYAQALGCTNTSFTNVHGLHDENQYTTAKDMARILAVAVKNSDFFTLFSTIHYNVPSTNKSEERMLSSGNFLMNTDDMQIYYDTRVTGGRTATTADGRRSLAISAEHNGMELICVTMGSKDVLRDDGYTITVYGSYKETSALLDAAFNGYKTVQVLFPGQTIKQCSVLNGDSDVILGSKNSAYAVLPADMSITGLSYRFSGADQFQAPIEKGQVLSSVQLWSGNVCVAQTDLVSMNSVAVASPTSVQNQHGNSNGIGKVILIVFSAVVVVVVITVLGIRLYSYFRYKVRHERRRRARRRSR